MYAAQDASGAWLALKEQLVNTREDAENVQQEIRLLKQVIRRFARSIN